MSRPQSCIEGAALDSQSAKSNRRSKVTPEMVALLVLFAVLGAAVIVIYRLSFEHMRTKEMLKHLEAVNKNLTVEIFSKIEAFSTVQPTCPTCPQPPAMKDEPCYRCEAGWEHHGGKCYHFSISKSSWNQSRAECRAKGGDLVKIDSREEQRFLDGRVRNLMNEAEDKFWIGLTDSAAEGRWMWVDNTPLNESFWLSGQPDDWRGKNPEGENCVRMGEKGGAPDLKSWNDAPCSVPQRSICEKAEVTEQIKYVCT